MRKSTAGAGSASRRPNDEDCCTRPRSGLPSRSQDLHHLEVDLIELVTGLAPTHDTLHPSEPLHLREALSAHGVVADPVKIWQTVGKLRRRHGLVLRGEPRKPGEAREAGYRVEDWTWEARRVRSSLHGA